MFASSLASQRSVIRGPKLHANPLLLRFTASQVEMQIRTPRNELAVVCGSQKVVFSAAWTVRIVKQTVAKSHVGMNASTGSTTEEDLGSVEDPGQARATTTSHTKRSLQDASKTSSAGLTVLISLPFLRELSVECLAGSDAGVRASAAALSRTDRL